MRPGLVAVLATDVVFAAVCVDALSGPVEAGSRVRLWRSGRIIRAGAPGALGGFRMIPRFL